MLRSSVWILSGFTKSESGTLTLRRDRLRLDTGAGVRRFDVPLSAVEAIVFPWYYFGGGMKLQIGGERYRISFARPGNLPDVPDDTGDWHATGREWKRALQAHS